jgi:hypothetical protein
MLHILLSRARAHLVLLGAGLALIAAAMFAASSALASHPEASLPGSNFEIDVDANLKVDDPAPSTDWAGVAEIRATDKVNGTGDDSYAGGVKEDTVCPAATTDSIPPNKSDLLSFHVFREPGNPSNPAGYLNLAWSRVSEPSGTTLMDFEFNQSSTKCSSGPNVVRTVGDLLIEYTIDQGGSRADIAARRWTGTEWGPATDLDVPSMTCGGAPCAAGTINSSPIPAADSDGLITDGAKQARTFGEAQLDLRLIFQPNKCTSFGSAMLKSRSSDSFTSQLKDFVAPVGINLQNCANVIIRKQTIPEENPNTTSFGYTKNFNTDPVSPNTFTLMDDGVKNYNNTVVFGTGYTVTEDVIPQNWALDHVDCSASSSTVSPAVNGATVSFALDEPTDVVDCTYFNALQVGALRILKNSTKGGPVAQPGAVFSYDGSSVTDNGAGDADPDVGEVCVSGLVTGNYTVNETSPPPGYGDATETDLVATVVTGTNCTDNQPTGAGVVTFTNAPLADIQVNFRDGGSGETSAQSISCANTGTTADTTTASGWDSSVTHEDISIDPSPRTITCTIVIDP